MGRRKLTPAEIAAYEEMALAARKLRAAQEQAEADRQSKRTRDAARSGAQGDISLSMDATRKGATQ